MTTMFDDDYYGKLFSKKKTSSSSTKTRPSAGKKPSKSLAPHKPATSHRPISPRATPGSKLGGGKLGGGKKPFVAPHRLGMGKGPSGWENLAQRYAQPGSNVIPYEEQTPFDEGVAEGVPGPIVPQSGEELVSPDEGIPEEALDELSGQALDEMGFGDEDETLDPIESEPTDYDEENYGMARFDAHQVPMPSRRMQDLARRHEAEEGHVFASPAPPSYGRYGGGTDVAPKPSPFMEGLAAGAGVGVGFMAVLVGVNLVGRALRGK